MAESPGADDWLTASTPYLAPRADGRADAWRDEAAAAGRTGTQLLREVAEIPAPADIAEALRLDAGESVVVRRRTILLDGRPIELTDSYYPRSLAAGTALAERRKIRGGAVTLLASLGRVVSEAVEDITFRQATSGESGLLGLPVDAWVVELRRTSSASDGRPFEVSVMTMVPEGRRFRYRITAGEARA